MAAIRRNPARSARDRYDLAVIGGGVYGAMLALEAARRDLKPLLVEQGDFGCGTSFNTLRIVHGGLRYLQGLDLYRFYESVQERRWFLTHFSDLVTPLPCLMPLYGEGPRRKSVLRLALQISDLCSMWRNRGVPRDRHLPSSRIISAREARQLFPQVDGRGLEGAAVWHDARMPDSQRIVVESLRWACARGAVVMNYVEAMELLTVRGSVVGLRARDLEGREAHDYRTEIVINAAGPWSRMLAGRFDRDDPRLFMPTLAWNILFDRQALSDYALALTPRRRGAQTYFMLPFKGRILVGTGHASWDGDPGDVCPSPVQIATFIENLNEAVPGLGLRQQEIVRIFSGLLPAGAEGKTQLAVREVIRDHGKAGGPRGLYSVSGVKFTTARRVAEKALRKVFEARLGPPQGDRLPSAQARSAYAAGKKSLDPTTDAWRANVKRIIEEESVIHLDDLILRRTALWVDHNSAMALAPRLVPLFAWDARRGREEIARLQAALRGIPQTPAAPGRYDELGLSYGRCAR